MTAGEVLAAVKLRWYAPLVALFCGAGLVVLFFLNSGVYATQTVVQFIHLEPSQGAISPNSDIENGNFIAFAGAVASDVNNGRPVLNYARETAPLYGAGLRDGVRVSIPDSGGQWMQSFTRAEIVIQIVGTTEEAVATRQRELLEKVEDSSRSLLLVGVCIFLRASSLRGVRQAGCRRASICFKRSPLTPSLM